MLFRFFFLSLVLIMTAYSSHADASGATIASLTDNRLTFTTLDGDAFALNKQSAKAILLVNTASRCGFTGQYADLQTLYERYKDQGLLVMAVPSNDFGGQEPLEGQDIYEFCKLNYNVTFPIMQKVRVKGKQAHPFYQHIRQHYGFTGSPKWNFYKYLINDKGQVVDWFSSVTSPKSARLVNSIESLLATTSPAQQDTRMSNNDQ